MFLLDFPPVEGADRLSRKPGQASLDFSLGQALVGLTWTSVTFSAD